MGNYPFLEYKDCIICGSSNSTVLYSWKKEYYKHSKYETCSWDGRKKILLNIVKCAECNLVYTRPSFTQEYLHLVYPRDIIPKEESVGKMFKSNEKYASLIDIILRHRKKGTLLDIGTRYGVFPWLAEKYGFDAYGIEYNLEAVKSSRKYYKNIFHGSSRNIEEIIEVNELEEPNIIVLDDVLEHLVNPTIELGIFSRIQDKGDFLVLRQMDYNSLGRKLYRKNWYYFQPAAHQFYFDKKSIENLLNQFDYKIVKIYKMPLIKNLLRTIYKNCYKSMITIYKNYCKNRKESYRQSKPLYLINRLASYNDMFTVVAIKK